MSSTAFGQQMSVHPSHVRSVLDIPVAIFSSSQLDWSTVYPPRVLPFHVPILRNQWSGTCRELQGRSSAIRCCTARVLTGNTAFLFLTSTLFQLPPLQFINQSPAGCGTIFSSSLLVTSQPLHHKAPIRSILVFFTPLVEATYENPIPSRDYSVFLIRRLCLSYD